MPTGYTTSIEPIVGAIHWIRGQRVMLDSDLAGFYGVTTKRLLQQFRRNLQRFPNDFAFQPAREALAILRLQFATSSSHGGARYVPWVFTEHGAIMLASVLNSPIATAASVQVVRAFVRLRQLVASHGELAAKLSEIERRIEGHDKDLEKLFTAIRRLIEQPEPPPDREMGFHVREDPPAYGTNRKTSA